MGLNNASCRHENGHGCGVGLHGLKGQMRVQVQENPIQEMTALDENCGNGGSESVGTTQLANSRSLSNETEMGFVIQVDQGMQILMEPSGLNTSIGKN